MDVLFFFIRYNDAYLHWDHVRRLLLLCSAVVLWLLLTDAQAQITFDGSVGPSGYVAGPDYTIPAEMGQQHGANLFHSFGDFNVQVGERATFAGPDSVRHIIGRVTGSNPSRIDGILRSDIAGADLYLLNPQGVMFGPHASLEVSGSFHASTADEIRFQDGAVFSADLGRERTLTTAPPAAFGFLQAQPASISVAGSQLQVSEGETLALIGGGIDISGEGRPEEPAGDPTPTLGAPQGQIHLVSVGSSGEVLINVADVAAGAQALSPQVETFERLGTISISNFALVSTEARGGGRIVMRGQDLQIDDALVWSNTLIERDGADMGIDIDMTGDVTLANGALIDSSTFGSGNSGDIRIRAGGKVVVAESLIKSQSLGNGSGGDVLIDTSDLMMSNRGAINVSSFGAGPGGRVTIRASEAVSMTSRSRIDAQSLDSGASGGVLIEASAMTMSNRSVINTTTQRLGTGGDVTIRSRDTVTINNADITANTHGTAAGSGRGGNVRVETSAFTLNRGRLTARTFGAGDSGNITLQAGESVVLRNNGGIRIDARVGSSGAGGEVLVEAPVVTFEGRGGISARAEGLGAGGDVTIRASESVTLTGAIRIGVQSHGTMPNAGSSGDVLIEAPVVTFSDSAQVIATTLGPGDGGNVTVRASESITITGSRSDSRGFLESGIFALTQDRVAGGKGGDIVVEAPIVRFSAGGRLSSTVTGSGQGGSVTVRARDMLIITGRDEGGGFSSGLYAEATDTSSGEGGKIVVQAREVLMRDGARITAESTGTGNAGSITITVTEHFRSDNSFLATKAVRSDGGNIALTAQNLIQLRHSRVEANVGAGAASVGGNVTLGGASVVMQNSQVVANAFEGQGGNIQITASRAVLADSMSVLDASSELGVDGQVDVQSPVTDLSSITAPLQESLAQAEALLASHCAGRFRQGQLSRFTVVGRDRVPDQPAAPLASPLMMSPENLHAEGARSERPYLTEAVPVDLRPVWRFPCQ